MPKTIVCYGDSNTWGFDPETSLRYPSHQRWPGVLRQQLGNDYLVVEEGLVGRTTVRDDPLDPHKNGLAYLTPCLQSHSPIDLVILMLGSNDMKRHFDLSPSAIAEGIRILVSVIQNSACGIDLLAPKLLLLSPPPIIGLTALADLFGGAEQKSLDLPSLYAEIAAESDCWFYDAGQAICSSPTDGVHFDVDQHQKLGRTLTEKVIKILN